MKKISNKIIILFGIILVASFLRLWQLGSVPPAPDWDEAALGYNAYSILHTGKDEYGSFLPIVLRSFDDYKPALYAYLVIPSIKLFGLNVFAVRFPAAAFGVLAVLGTYFLVKELTKNEVISLLASFLLAISPWHIQFTHAAFEASVGMALNLFAVLFFIKGVQRPRFLFLSIFCISASLYVYQSEKVFSPLLFLALIIIYRRRLFSLSKMYIIAGIIFGLLITLPLLSYIFTNKDALARAKGVSFLSDVTSFLKSDAQRLLQDTQSHDKIGLFFDNRRIVFGKEVIANYISHVDLNWLFITGDISRHHAPGMGLLYIWELPFLLIGIYQVFFGSFNKKTKIILITWFLLVPVPASVTTGVPHAIRTFNFLPLFQIATAIGLFAVWQFLLKYSKLVRYTGILVFMFIFLFNFLYYTDQYFVQQNYYTSVDWQYGYAKVVPQVKNLEGKYKKIIVSNQPYMDQSYIFLLFYLQYSPSVYQMESQYASGGFRENHMFGKFEFRPITWDKEQKSPDILYVGRTDDFPSGVHTLYQVNVLNNDPGMMIVQG